MFTALLILTFAFQGFSQKNKDIIPVVECVKLLKNGVYQATFGYENPTNKEVVIDESGSTIKTNNGKKVAKGLNKFKPGTNNKTFTKEFGPGDYVVWTIISNGNTHEVIANANSSKCSPDDGFIEPIIGNGKSDGLSGNELLAFCEGVAGESPSSLIFQSRNDNGVLQVLLEIIPKPGFMQDVLDLLLTSGVFNIDNSDFLLDPDVYDFNTLSAIDVYMSKDEICFLNDYANVINFARPVYPPTINSGGVVSQGDSVQTSNLVRESFRMKNSEGLIVPVTGENITVGCLSDSYDTFNPGSAAIDVANGELPDDVIVRKENPFKASDEGRAMMQIIHDVAPGANLEFHTGSASLRQLEVGMIELAKNCDIIVDDITFITEPFFGTGRIAEYINSNGIFHITAAGNIGNKAHQGVFNPTTGTPPTNFLDPSSPTVAHDFDAGPGVDYLQKISVVPGEYLITLQWKEELASQDNQEGALEDLDIYIVDDEGRLLVGSNRVNVLGDPTEVIGFRATGTGEANIMITSTGPTNVPFRYIAFRTAAEDGTPDGLKISEYFGDGAPTTSGLAMNPGSVTVGAVDYRKAGDTPPLAEYFSSYAGLLSDGTTSVIDQYAPDGVNTTVPTIGQPATCATCDGDSFLNFYGTSAAAPHYAGAAALLLSAAQAWFPPVEQAVAQSSTTTSSFSAKTSYTSAQAIQLFQNTGEQVDAPVGSEGRFLNTLEAFKSIAAQSVRNIKLIVEDGKNPSAEPFTVTIIGDFFPEDINDVTVLLGDQELENVQFETITVDGETIKAITATVPEFVGNPAVEIQVTSKTGEGGDGSGGDKAYFFDEGKIALSVTAKSATFEYGQDILSTYYAADPSDPDYEQPFTVEGLPEGMTFADLQALDNLPPVILGNQAVDDQLADSGYPRVADYVITPSFGDQVLTPEQQEKYQINFKSGYLDPNLGKVGYLTITKKDLTITTEPVTITYGESVVVPLVYQYDNTGIADDSDFLAYISNAHDSDFFEENRLALINKYTAILAKYPAILSTLEGGSWIASEQTITSKYNAVLSKYNGILSNMGLIDLDEDDFKNYFDANDAYGDGTIVSKYPAILSKFNAILSSEDLFRGNVTLYDPITNKLNAILSKYPAILSTDTERPYGQYESIFAIVSDEEPFSGEFDEDGLPIVEIPKLYALNLITGLDVTAEGESHSIFPGTFINSITNNFVTAYEPGQLFVLPATLTASTVDLEIPYGQVLSKDDLVTTFEGWAYDDPFQESEATVFPEEEGGIPYYFLKLNEDGSASGEELEISELTQLGEYRIMIRNPKNYVIEYLDDSPGILTITEATLSFNPEAQTISYGQNPVMNPLAITGFAYEEDATVLNDDSGSIPYYFMREGDANEYTIGGELKMPVGVYDVFIKDDPNDNYVIEHVEGRGQLTVTEAALVFNPTALEYSYGTSPQIDPASITGFAEGEGPEVLYDGSGQIPYYFTKDGDATIYTIGGEAKMGVGVYDIFITDDSSDNYTIQMAEGRGQLTVVPLEVSVMTENLEETYGYLLGLIDLTTTFDAFAYDETSGDVFGSGGIPYYFVAGGSEYELGTLLEVGFYDIRVRQTNDNYVFEYSDGFNSLEVTRAVLFAQIDDLFINQGDVPQFTATFDGFVAGEDETTVYPEGIPFYFVDEFGVEASNTDVGAFTIRIRDDRKNYTIVTNEDATLYINPFDGTMRKVRTYSDCVSYDENTGLYTVTFRYENDNSDPVFVPVGPDNFLSGDGYIGNNSDLPTVFMPGSGVFDIEFNGGQLIWSLTTYDGTQKSGVSSATTDGSGECEAKLDGVYRVYPNPVSTDLTVEQTVPEQSEVYIVNMYGIVVSDVYRFDGFNDLITIDMSGYATGLYIVRIVSSDDVRTINILKE